MYFPLIFPYLKNRKYAAIFSSKLPVANTTEELYSLCIKSATGELRAYAHRSTLRKYTLDWQSIPARFPSSFGSNPTGEANITNTSCLGCALAADSIAHTSLNVDPK